MEIWKDVAGYEGLYQVSDMGNVRSLDHYASNGIKDILYKGRNLVHHKNPSGYMAVCLSKKSAVTRMYIHRLVAEAFIDNPDMLPEVNHIDQNPENNCVCNLEWCDRLYNANYKDAQERKARSRGKAVEQYDLNGKLLQTYYSTHSAATAIGKKWGSTPISECCYGKRKQAYNYIWRFKEVQ